jgi:3-methylcrotonyl-CoA carboxylase alpha subunit
VRHDGRVETFHCVRDGRRIHFAWRGIAYRLEEEKESSRAAAGPLSGALEAPMPGKVLKVSVAVGDTVTKGQEVLVVEAMKMENTLRAPRDGKVRAIAVQVGDRVTPGSLLVDLQ